MAYNAREYPGHLLQNKLFQQENFDNLISAKINFIVHNRSEKNAST